MNRQNELRMNTLLKFKQFWALVKKVMKQMSSLSAVGNEDGQLVTNRTDRRSGFTPESLTSKESSWSKQLMPCIMRTTESGLGKIMKAQSLNRKCVLQYQKGLFKTW